jgi:hypothetical protein
VLHLVTADAPESETLVQPDCAGVRDIDTQAYGLSGQVSDSDQLIDGCSADSPTAIRR